MIVAAGISSRMGKFKPMLRIGRETIIRRMARMLKEAGADPIVVVTGYYREELEKHLRDLDLVFVHNDQYMETKMFDSAKKGFEVLGDSCDRIFFTPGDVPLVRNDTIELLKQQPGTFVRPVCRHMSGHPVVFDARILPEILSYCGEGGLRGAIEKARIPIAEVAVEDEGTVMDVDSRKEYEKLLIQNSAVRGERENLRMELRLSIGTDELFFDDNMAVFLELITATGSMSAACQAMHMSYTKGWRMINKLEDKLNVKVLRRNVGGREGGSSMLTREGQYILKQYVRMAREIEAAGEQIFRKYFGEI